MTDVADLHRRALSTVEPIVAGITPAMMGNATPCEGWDVRALLNHVVAGNWWAAELANGKTIDEVGAALDGDVVGDDPLATYRDSSRAADEAFSKPGAMDAPCAVSYGPVPGSVYAGHRFIDVLIHGWDLAQATGQQPAMPADLVAACWEVVTPQIDMVRASGMFGDDLPVPDDADQTTRLLALMGRDAS